MVTNTIDKDTEKSEQAAKMSQTVTSSGSTGKERIEQESEEEKAEKKAKEQEQKVQEEEEKRREDLIEELGSAVKFIGQQGPISITEHEIKQLIFLGNRGLPYGAGFEDKELSALGPTQLCTLHVILQTGCVILSLITSLVHMSA